MLSTIMLPMAPIFNLGWKAASLPTVYEVIDALARGDRKSAGQEIIFDGIGNGLDELPGLVPHGGTGVGAVDIAMDIGDLSDLERGYLRDARINVALQVAQAETAFMNAHLATLGIFPWNSPSPHFMEHPVPLVLAP